MHTCLYPWLHARLRHTLLHTTRTAHTEVGSRDGHRRNRAQGLRVRHRHVPSWQLHELNLLLLLLRHRLLLLVRLQRLQLSLIHI